jgi:molybdate transport system permease protein
VLASVLVNLPFAVQPMQNALAAIPPSVRDAARCCGLSPLAAVRRIELPLALPGIATGAVLTFAHTLGEFGVVLMVGGSIPGETRTIAIAIYDRVQAFDEPAAATMALVLLVLAVAALGISNTLARRATRRD